MPNFIDLAAIGKKLFEGNPKRPKQKKEEEERKIHFWLQIGYFTSPVKSKVFRISACGFQHRVDQDVRNRMS